MNFDRFDIAEAYYFYAMHYHDGQWGKLYHLLCYLTEKIKYYPGRCQNEPESENAKEIYQRLVDTEGKDIRDRRN